MNGGIGQQYRQTTPARLGNRQAVALCQRGVHQARGVTVAPVQFGIAQIRKNKQTPLTLGMLLQPLKQRVYLPAQRAGDDQAD